MALFFSGSQGADAKLQLRFFGRILKREQHEVWGVCLGLCLLSLRLYSRAARVHSRTLPLEARLLKLRLCVRCAGEAVTRDGSHWRRQGVLELFLGAAIPCSIRCCV
jgi:hypothetical protein